MQVSILVLDICNNSNCLTSEMEECFKYKFKPTNKRISIYFSFYPKQGILRYRSEAPRSFSFTGTAVSDDSSTLIVNIQTERSKSSSCLENSFISQDTFTKFGTSLWFKALQQSSSKLLRSDHYSIKLSFKLINQNQNKDVFIPFTAIKKCTCKEYYYILPCSQMNR